MNLRFRIVAGITAHMKKMDFMRLVELLKNDSGLLPSEQGQPDWIVSNKEFIPEQTLKFVPRENIQVFY